MFNPSNEDDISINMLMSYPKTSTSSQNTRPSSPIQTNHIQTEQNNAKKQRCPKRSINRQKQLLQMSKRTQSEIEKCKRKMHLLQNKLKDAHKLKSNLQNQMNCSRITAMGNRLYGNLQNPTSNIIETVRLIAGQLAIQISSLDIELDQLKQQKKMINKMLRKLYEVKNIRI